MKNRVSHDPRVMQNNGMPSRSRVVIIEALETMAKEGATIDEIVDLVGADLGVSHPKMSVGSTLSKMEADGFVTFYRNRWYLKEHFFKPAPAEQNGHAPQAGPRAPIAPQVQKRSGRTVSLYTAPTVFSDVISLALLIKEQWFEIPFWGAIRVCVGHEIPDWSSDKRWYYNVEVMKIMFKGGQVEERRPDSKDVITIDAEE